MVLYLICWWRDDHIEQVNRNGPEYWKNGQQTERRNERFGRCALLFISYYSWNTVHRIYSKYFSWTHNFEFYWPSLVLYQTQADDLGESLNVSINQKWRQQKQNWSTAHRIGKMFIKWENNAFTDVEEIRSRTVKRKLFYEDVLSLFVFFFGSFFHYFV